ncbi:MAG: V-type ATP synthase subunit I [Spirochaetes bacterium ADurb.Bin110]|nr:MAG: V-type ATP synthase subunit I [Spirochaetes bacterium ADurb.Bin110]
MIVPMKKFYLIVLQIDRENLPERLRKLGVAHVEELQGIGGKYQDLEREKAEAESAYFLLQNYIDKKSKPSKADASISLKSEEYKDVRDIIREISAAKQRLDLLEDRSIDLKREIDRVASWGEVSMIMLERVIENANFSLRFFDAPMKELTALPEETEYIRISAPKGRCRIGLILHEGEETPELPPSFLEFLPPEIPLSQMRKEIASIESQKQQILREFREKSANLTLIKKYLHKLNSSITLERLRSGMPQQESLAYMKGYVPARDCEKFKKTAAKYGWAIGFDDPVEEDQPPTLVENPPAVRIIQPVFEFLGTVPNYWEYDISSWFLIFFSIFFAMIFGDASYGTIIVLATIATIIAGKRKRKPIGDAQKLFLLLGSITIIWGALTATWFGISFDNLPKLLQDISLPLINGQSPDSENNIKVLCFSIGLIQLSIAHLKNLKRDFPDLKFLSQAGSLLLLLGMFNAALNLVIDATRFPIGNWAIICIAIGFFLVFIFGNWDGKLGSSLLESLKNIIPTFLGTVSVFADIVSYIRLWAVGLAGLAFSQTVNGMASGMLGGPSGIFIGFILKLIVAAVILVAAHALNFMLTILSVIVHGIRLNMLEFSGHLGMEWSGYKYDPLKEDENLSAS